MNNHQAGNSQTWEVFNDCEDGQVITRRCCADTGPPGELAGFFPTHRQAIFHFMSLNFLGNCQAERQQRALSCVREKREVLNRFLEPPAIQVHMSYVL